MAEKKGFFDFLKNKNVKKLEEKGYDRYGLDPKKMKDKEEQKKFQKIKDMFKGKKK